MMNYLMHLVVMVGIYTILSQGLLILTGLTGIVSVMQVSFYGIGAYVSALTALRLGMPFLVSLVFAVLGAGVAGLIIGRLISRLSGDYLALVTFGVGLIFYDIFNNWLSLTKGPMGLPGIAQPFHSKIAWSFFTVFLVALSFTFTTLIAASPFGRLLRAIRDDEGLATVLGRNTRKVKALAFMISAALAGLAGSVYAHYITFIDPSSFTVMESVNVLVMVIIGGLTRVGGSIIGPAFLVLLPEILRFFGLPAEVAASLRQALFGLFLLLAVLYRPQGLIHRRAEI